MKERQSLRAALRLSATIAEGSWFVADPLPAGPGAAEADANTFHA
jgi:hypothetical protein